MNKRVVITGLGIVAPNGTGIPAFTQAIKQGKSGIRYIQELEDCNFSCRVGGVPDISSEECMAILEKYHLTESDIAIKYAVIAGIEAWLSASLEIPDYFSGETNDNYGAVIGTTSGGMEIFARKLIPFVTAGNIKKLGSQIIENIMPSGSTAVLSHILALSNQINTNSSACATGTEAVAMAYERIKSGKSELMLAGGTDPYSPFCWAGFDSMRVLCRNFNDAPDKASRPMSESAAGFVPAAGAGILILESLEHAQKRNARIFAEITGCHINSGGQRNGGSMTLFNPEKAVKCIESAISDAGITGKDADLICGHLTGTKADPDEIKIWKKALMLNNDFPYINSLKSMTGHLIGAAGAVELIAAGLQLYHGFIHPSLNCEDIHEDIADTWPLDKIASEPDFDYNLKHVVKASFGFGDVNACVVLKKYD